MFTLESHVDVSKIRAGRGNPVVMSLDPSPQISFTIENANINKDLFSALCYNLSQVGTTAAEAGQALRKIVQVFNQENQTWSYTNEEEDLRHNAITMLQNSRGVDLLRPETPNATETPNQNSHFNFLEQNAYEEADSGWLTPLDSI